MFIGLMGIGDDGRTMYAPNGKRLFVIPSYLAAIIQRVQHKIARLTHR